jgi:hypothetical protein
MVLKKLVMLHLFKTVVEPIACLLFVMMFGNGEAQWEESVVESNEGMNDGRSKKGHLVKTKYLNFLEEILDPSK